MGVTNREIQEMGGECVLKAAISGLLSDQPVLDNSLYREHILPSGIVRWVSHKPENWSKPKWHETTKQDIAAANALVDRYLVQSITKLEHLMQENTMPSQNGAFEELCNAYLNKVRQRWIASWAESRIVQIHAVLLAAGQYLVDFDMPEGMTQRLASLKDVTPLSIAGVVQIKLGKPGLREKLCETLLKLCPLLEDAEPTILLRLVESIEMAINAGSHIPPDDFGELQDLDEDTTSADTYFIEPAIAHPFVKHDQSLCLKRRPFYQALGRVWEHYRDRMGTASYQIWHSTAYLFMDSAETVPVVVGRLMDPLFRFAMHAYDDVADGAQGAVEYVFKRFPVLARLYAPLIMPSLTRSWALTV